MGSNIAKLAEAQRAPRPEAPEPPGWPEPPGPAAYHGPVGELVKIIEPHTEADPAALLVQILIALGNIVGRTPHTVAEADRHGCNLFALLVGPSGKGRKGASQGQARRVYRAVDAQWADNQILGGLSSGEGLIAAVRDPVDGAAPDKRVLCLESEFARVLGTMGREGNSLSCILRQAWDDGRLSVLTRKDPLKASSAHISIIAHITRNELLRRLDSGEAANGFLNRFLVVAVRRSKVLAEGGNLREHDLAEPILRLDAAVRQARHKALPFVRDEAAKRLWAEVYPALSEGKPGLLGAALGRAEAQVTRLALLYTVLDGAESIEEPHLKAALALWHFVERSTAWALGEALGDPVADEILAAIRKNKSMSRSEIRELLQHNASGATISRALASLDELGRVTRRTIPTGGRPEERWFLRST